LIDWFFQKQYFAYSLIIAMIFIHFRYAKECYAEASGSADEKGRIDKAALKQKKEERVSNNANGATTNDPAELKRRLNMMETVLHASRDICSNLDPMVATKKIVKNA
jgi:hypothetical protein